MYAGRERENLDAARYHDTMVNKRFLSMVEARQVITQR